MIGEPVAFPSEGATLRGRFLPGAAGAGGACVVMAHGFASTIAMGLDAYARALNEAGFAVLIYDHRNLGQSDGEPRGEVNPWVQARGYRDAVAFVRGSATVDPSRVALWGVSYSGLEVLVVGALIPGLAAIVAQVPGCGTELPGIEPDDATLKALRETLKSGDVSATAETTTGPMPIVSPDPVSLPCLLPPIQAYRWFIGYGSRHGSFWENRASRVVPATPVPFHPYLTARYLGVRTLMLVGRGDEMERSNPIVQRAVFAEITAPKQLIEIDGGHFGALYVEEPLFQRVVGMQIGFLDRHLREVP